MRYVILAVALLVASPAFADPLPPLNIGSVADLSAALGAYDDMRKVDALTQVNYAVVLARANATVAALKDTLTQLDAEQDAEQDAEAKEPPK